MLDPLTALSVASSVVQFVDFGIKLVTEGYELYEKGGLLQNDEIELVTKDLTRLTKNLAAKPSFERNYSVVSGDERELQNLASSCQQLGDQLLSLLASLKPRQPQSGLESFRKAVRSMRKRGTVTDIEKRLERFQKQLVTHLIAILRYQCHDQNSSNTC